MSAAPERERRLRVRDVVLIGRPWFWPVSLVPFVLGVVLAARSWHPPVASLPRVLTAGLVVGPLVWLAVLAVNDAHDLPSDRSNPRKSASPLVAGRVSRQDALRLATAAGLAATAVGLTLGPLFALGTAAVVVLGWAYSAPPVRLKERPVADVIVNAVAVGLLGQLGGWVVIRPISGFPWEMGLLGVLVGAALYLPTTAIDHGADLRAGYSTSSVRFGPRLVFRSGALLWLAAVALSVTCCAADAIIPRSLLSFQVVMAPILAVAYLGLMRRPSMPRVAILSSLFLLPCAVFMAAYTGLL